MMVIAIIVMIIIIKFITEKKYKELEFEVLRELGLSSWDIVSYYDEYVTVKSRQALEKYDDVKFFKENREKLIRAENIISRKNEITRILGRFLNDNEYKTRLQYRRLVKQINEVLKNAGAYRICVNYISSAGN